MGYKEADFIEYIKFSEEKMSIFEDNHLIDVWYKREEPAYQKVWTKGSERVLFIVHKKCGKWHIFIQFPFCRVKILSEYSGEKNACTALRIFIREKEMELFSFSQVSKYIEETKEKLRSGEIELKLIETELKERESSMPWLLYQHNFSIKIIMEYMNNIKEND